jgi:hypothetical protein
MRCFTPQSLGRGPNAHFGITAWRSTGSTVFMPWSGSRASTSAYQAWVCVSGEQVRGLPVSIADDEAGVRHSRGRAPHRSCPALRVSRQHRRRRRSGRGKAFRRSPKPRCLNIATFHSTKRVVISRASFGSFRKSSVSLSLRPRAKSGRYARTRSSQVSSRN